MKKLKETLVAVQQLDKNMNILRAWLAHIESELSKPIVYETCDSEEIQRKLNEQQVKQKYEVEEQKSCITTTLRCKMVRVTQVWYRLGPAVSSSVLQEGSERKMPLKFKADDAYGITLIESSGFDIQSTWNCSLTLPNRGHNCATKKLFLESTTVISIKRAE
uniref:Uncharacterized protein n=1 Tax=Sphaerodactylus townsendi TaxID=933632 RepID=A0ACB8GBB5_9SAUR